MVGKVLSVHGDETIIVGDGDSNVAYVVKHIVLLFLDGPFNVKELGIWSNHNSLKVILKQYLDQIR